MNLFYSEKITESNIILDAEEASHCTRVLRKKVGDEVHVIDGNGKLFITEISKIDKRSCTCKVINIIKNEPRKYRVHLLISPTKNIVGSHAKFAKTLQF